jgi:S1-C subfamily serine protease
LFSAAAICLLAFDAIVLAREPLKDAQALEAAMERAIAEAEPSVACVLVSRSQVYRNWFGESISSDSPGKLGAFDPNRAFLTPTTAAEIARVDELRNELAKRPGLGQPKEIDREINRRFDLSDPSHVPESFGSGIVIDADGLILTNFHVVRDAKKIYVRLPGGKGSYADIHAADGRSDLAVLKVLDPEILPLQRIQLGDGGRLRKGQFVISIANPFAAGFRDGSPSASWGIISNLRRRAPAKPMLDEMDRFRIPWHQYGTLVQADARLNLGCSGGALIDLEGKLVGLTTAMAAVTGGETAGGFAVPIDQHMRDVVDALVQGKEVEHGFLGVSFGPSMEPRDPPRLNLVIPNSPAARAGLEPGDVIMAVNDVPVRESDDLYLAIGILPAGSEARITARSSDGQTKMVRARLAKSYQPADRFIASNRRPLVYGLRVDYTSVLVQRDLGFRSSFPQGVYVSEVQSNSPADTARLQDAVITKVNDQPVGEPDEFYKACDAALKSGSGLELTVAGREGAGVRKVKLH